MDLLAFIVGIPLLLFYFLRNWIAAYDAREADKEEAFNKELRKDPERAIDRAPWKYESRADYDARMATMDAYDAREADKELRKDLESTTERRENHPEHDSTRADPPQLSASKPREPACHPHSETPFNPAAAFHAATRHRVKG